MTLSSDVTPSPGNSEIDTIRTINSRKGFKGNDSVTNPPEAEQPKPASVSGSDNSASSAPAEESEAGVLRLTTDQLQKYMQAGEAKGKQEMLAKFKELDGRFESFKQESDAAMRKASQEKTDLEKALQAEKENKDALAKVFTDFGYVPPVGEDSVYIASSSMRGGISPTDCAREFVSILDSRDATPSAVWCSPYTGETFVQKDMSKAEKYLRENKEKLRDGMEAYAKKHGLLRGKTSMMLSGKDAATAKADIPPAFLDYLSAFLRMSHSPKFIFHQFANKRLELGKGPGDTIQVPRVAYAETGSATTDWELTPGTPIVADNQPITASSVSIVLKEYGMGKSNTLRPIGIPEFVMAYSLIDLEQALQRNLGHNFNEFEDLSLRSLWLATTRVVYNKKGSVVTAPASVTAGDDGTLTYKFLNALYAYMCGLQIPAYMNGKYGLTLHSTALAQLKNDLAGQNQYLKKDDLSDITNIFNAATQSDMAKVSGYEGDIANFMIFSTNAISLGAAGTPGAQTETIGGAANTTRSSFAFGADSITEAVGLPMQVRKDANDDFARLMRFTWISFMGFGYLDVEPAINASQQLRVLEIRTTDLAV